MEPNNYMNSATLTYAILCIICCVMALIVAIASFNRRTQIKTLFQLSYFALALFGWNFTFFIFLILPNTIAMQFAHSAGYIFIAFAALTFFFFSYVHFTETEHINKKLLSALIIIPLITSAVTFMYPFTGFFQSYTTEITFTPIKHLESLLGPWFYVHATYSYLLIIIGSVLLVIKSLKKVTRNRLMYILIAIIAVIYCFQNIFVTFVNNNFSTYSTRIMHMLLLNIFFWTTFLDKDSVLTYYGKYTYIEKTSTPLLFFNLKNELIHINPSAYYFFDEIHIPYKKYMPYDSIFDLTTFSLLGNNYFEKTSEYFYLQHKQSLQVYYIEKSPIYHKKALGYSINLNNMKILDTLIENLEKYAYLDSLCQCSNRTLFENQKYDFLKTAQLPSAIAIADLDNLKHVNDTFGHHTGDEYLKIACSILQSVIDTKDSLFRYGGDEFILFFQNTSKSKMEKIINTVEQKCAQQQKEFVVNISVGYSLIENREKSFEQHFQIADSNMYKQKIQRKALM